MKLSAVLLALSAPRNLDAASPSGEGGPHLRRPGGADANGDGGEVDVRRSLLKGGFPPDCDNFCCQKGVGDKACGKNTLRYIWTAELIKNFALSSLVQGCERPDYQQLCWNWNVWTNECRGCDHGFFRYSHPGWPRPRCIKPCGHPLFQTTPSMLYSTRPPNWCVMEGFSDVSTSARMSRQQMLELFGLDYDYDALKNKLYGALNSDQGDAIDLGFLVEASDTIASYVQERVTSDIFSDSTTEVEREGMMSNGAAFFLVSLMGLQDISGSLIDMPEDGTAIPHYCFLPPFNIYQDQGSLTPPPPEAKKGDMAAVGSILVLSEIFVSRA